MKKYIKYAPIAALAALASCASSTDSDVITMLVGTYTYDTSHGIYSFAFNQQNGSFQAYTDL